LVIPRVVTRHLGSENAASHQPNRQQRHQLGVNIDVAAPLGAWTSHEDLVVRAQRGDLGAFEELIRQRLDRLFRLACGVLGNPAEAEDATQDACITAWQKLPTLRDVDRLDAWLGRVVVNTCRMRLRDRRRVREITLEDGWSNPAAADTPDPARMAQRAEDADLVARALDHVSVEDRALLVLHHVHRERVETIAATLGIPVGTVKWRLSRARHAVQRALEGER
jgi:RNA polymerase sigma-70 factor, ECF subfamily